MLLCSVLFCSAKWVSGDPASQTSCSSKKSTTHDIYWQLLHRSWPCEYAYANTCTCAQVYTRMYDIPCLSIQRAAYIQ